MFETVLVTVDGCGPAVAMKNTTHSLPDPDPMCWQYAANIKHMPLCGQVVDCRALSWKTILQITTGDRKFGTFVENLHNLPAVP
jgi:hypothetical protein